MRTTLSKKGPILTKSSTSNMLGNFTSTLGASLPMFGTMASYGMKATSMIASTSFEMIGLGLSGILILLQFLKK